MSDKLISAIDLLVSRLQRASISTNKVEVLKELKTHLSEFGMVLNDVIASLDDAPPTLSVHVSENIHAKDEVV